MTRPIACRCERPGCERCRCRRFRERKRRDDPDGFATAERNRKRPKPEPEPDDVIPALGHHFDENMRCGSCRISHSQHQIRPLPCRKVPSATLPRAARNSIAKQLVVRLMSYAGETPRRVTVSLSETDVRQFTLVVDALLALARPGPGSARAEHVRGLAELRTFTTRKQFSITSELLARYALDVVRVAASVEEVEP